MQQATRSDKTIIVDIIASAFDDNKSVNYVIPQGKTRKNRIRQLAAYSFEICRMFGEVLISEDRSGCALVLFPDKKMTTLRSVVLDARLTLATIGWHHILKTMRREQAVKKSLPPGPLYHIWYIGVQPGKQGKGTGSRLLQQMISRAKRLGRLAVLETSTQKNIPWYGKHGFRIYNALDFGFTLYCMKALS